MSPYPTEVRMSEWTCDLIEDSMRRCRIVLKDLGRDRDTKRHYQAHYAELESLLGKAKALAAEIKSHWDEQRGAS